MTFPNTVMPPPSLQALAFAALVPGSVFVLGYLLMNQHLLHRSGGQGGLDWGFFSVGLVLAVEATGILLMFLSRFPLFIPSFVGVFMGVWARKDAQPNVSRSILWRRLAKRWLGEAAPHALKPGLPMEEFANKLSSLKSKMLQDAGCVPSEMALKSPESRTAEEVLRPLVEFTGKELLLDESDREWQTAYEVQCILAYGQSPFVVLDFPSVLFGSGLGLWLAALASPTGSQVFGPIQMVLMVVGALTAVAHGIKSGSIGSSESHAIASALEVTGVRGETNGKQWQF